MVISSTAAALVAAASGCTVIVGLDVVPPVTDDAGITPSARDRADAGEQEGMDATTGARDAAEDSTVADAPGAPEASPAAEGGGDAATFPAIGVQASLLFSGTNVKIKGITGDDWLVYLDTSGNNFDYRAIPVRPGDAGVATVPSSSYTEISRVPYEGSADAMVINDLVFTWGGGTLTLWSSALGAQPVTVTGTSVMDLVWASEDSKHFAYIDSLSGGIYAVDGDGTNRRLLVSTTDSHCQRRLLFRGNYLTAGYCPGGSQNAILQAFDIQNGWTSTLQTSEALVSSLVDPNGTMVVAPVATGSTAYTEIFNLDGGPGRTLDPATPFIYGENNAGSLTYPWYIDYNDDAGVLWQEYASLSPPPRVLVDGGVNSFEAVSPSGKWLVAARSLDGTGHPLDLSVVSMANPGTPVLMATSTDGKSFRATEQSGWGFTADENYALFYSTVNIVLTNLPQNQQVAAGTFNAMQMSPPYTVFADVGGDSGRTTFDDNSVGGSRVLLRDNTTFVPSGDGSGNIVVDLDLLDLSKVDAGSTTIVKAVPREIAITSDGAHVVYVVPTATSADEAGIYVAPIP
jgi:hypothetical protein